jgi:two-component system, NarL family, invasion response regulator UvrY
MRIGIADPQSRVRFSLRTLFNQQGDWIVLGEASDCEELIELLRSSDLNLLLIDCDLPGMPVDHLLKFLRERYPSTRIILMSGRQELNRLALTAGATAFICKTEPPDRLLNLIHEIQDQDAKSFFQA